VLYPETLSETTQSWNSELQNIESAGGGNDEVWNRCAQSFFKNNNDRIPYFDIRYSLFDIRYLSVSGGFAFPAIRLPKTLYASIPTFSPSFFSAFRMLAAA
jgi:hypothetical protein